MRRSTPVPWLIVLLLASCCGKKQTAGSSGASSDDAFKPAFAAGPHVIVYKTRDDLVNNVPVILSDGGDRVVSYPDPADLNGASGPPLPTALHRGYLLDNRGINGRVAFLHMSYSDYAALQQAPSPDELMRMIKDKDPLLEMCDCGNKYAFTDVPGQLNRLIDDGKLRTTCKVVK